MSDIGKKRQLNEDYYSIQPACNLYIVADGMGGHNAGEIASRKATDALVSYFSAGLCKKIRGNTEEIHHAFISAFHHANDKIMTMSSLSESLSGMGSTLVACLIDNDTLHICHVGDSRCYICNEKNISLMTNDHSINNETSIPASDAENVSLQKNKQNILTRAIGFPFPEDPEYISCKLDKDARILLCSDGLWNMVDEQLILHAIDESHSPEIACSKLIRMANRAGGKDNITAVVVYT